MALKIFKLSFATWNVFLFNSIHIYINACLLVTIQLCVLFYIKSHKTTAHMCLCKPIGSSDGFVCHFKSLVLIKTTDYIWCCLSGSIVISQCIYCYIISTCGQVLRLFWTAIVLTSVISWTECCSMCFNLITCSIALRTL